jgi:hypothetical protein
MQIEKIAVYKRAFNIIRKIVDIDSTENGNRVPLPLKHERTIF